MNKSAEEQGVWKAASEDHMAAELEQQRGWLAGIPHAPARLAAVAFLASTPQPEPTEEEIAMWDKSGPDPDCPDCHGYGCMSCRLVADLVQPEPERAPPDMEKVREATIDELNGGNEDTVRLLREWANVLTIPSGTFVNDDLRRAADEIESLRDYIASLPASPAVEHPADKAFRAFHNPDRPIYQIAYASDTAPPPPVAGAGDAGGQAVARVMRDQIAAWLNSNGFQEAVDCVQKLPLPRIGCPALTTPSPSPSQPKGGAETKDGAPDSGMKRKRLVEERETIERCAEEAWKRHAKYLDDPDEPYPDDHLIRRAASECAGEIYDAIRALSPSAAPKGTDLTGREGE